MLAGFWLQGIYRAGGKGGVEKWPVRPKGPSGITGQTGGLSHLLCDFDREYAATSPLGEARKVPGPLPRKTEI